MTQLNKVLLPVLICSFVLHILLLKFLLSVSMKMICFSSKRAWFIVYCIVEHSAEAACTTFRVTEDRNSGLMHRFTFTLLLSY